MFKVRVDLFETAGVCSAASKRSRFSQEVEMGAQTTLAVPYVIIPMEKGKFGIEVKAAVRGSHLADGILKELKVVVKEYLRVPIEMFNLKCY